MMASINGGAFGSGSFGERPHQASFQREGLCDRKFRERFFAIGRINGDALEILEAIGRYERRHQFVIPRFALGFALLEGDVSLQLYLILLGPEQLHQLLRSVELIDLRIYLLHQRGRAYSPYRSRCMTTRIAGPHPVRDRKLKHCRSRQHLSSSSTPEHTPWNTSFTLSRIPEKGCR